MNSVDPGAVPNHLFLFLDWSWSKAAEEGRKRLEHMIGRMIPRLPLRVGCPDTEIELADWLTSECKRTGLPLHGGRQGPLLEILNGQAIAWIQDVQAAPQDVLDAFIWSSHADRRW